MTTPTVIRASSLSGYPDCPRRTAARLFRAEIKAAGFELRRTPRGIGAMVGTAVHESAKTVLTAVARGLALPGVAIAKDRAAETLGDELDKGEVLFDLGTQNRNEAFHQVTRMAAAYHRVIAPQVRPLLVEERLEAEISPGILLSGRPDLVAREPGRVRDLKTGTRAKAGAHSPQIGAYSLLSRTHHLQIEGAAIDYVQRVPPSRPQPDPVSKAVPVAQAETAAIAIIAHIRRDLATFREGDPAIGIQPGDPWAFPANPSSILCSEKYCPAFNTTFCNEGGQ